MLIVCHQEPSATFPDLLMILLRGNVVVAEIDGPVVKLELQGNCGSCPSSTMTMKMGLERRLKEKIPEISEVGARPVSVKGRDFPDDVTWRGHDSPRLCKRCQRGRGYQRKISTR
jgi:hypothetical protein